MLIAYAQAAGGRGRWAVGGPAGRGPSGGPGVAGFHLHEAAGDGQAEVGREAEVPVGCACDPRGHLRRQDLQEGHEHGADAVPSGCCQSSQSKFFI